MSLKGFQELRKQQNWKLMRIVQLIQTIREKEHNYTHLPLVIFLLKMFGQPLPCFPMRNEVGLTFMHKVKPQ